ncbi:PH domain-containing protein [Brevibacterium album]|uniref:PH domain-containing protein n=1 Tax=Brevibacterium album TaxID=417948 RepID=UPI0004085771|nr:PH domain-containing protein [Brevibacterium album]
MSEQPGDALVIRPRQVRIVGFVLAPLVVLAFAAASVAFSLMDFPGWRAHVDPVWMTGIGVLIAAVLLRFAALCARARADGLFVRNLTHSRTYPWEQLVGLTYSAAGGDPWARLDLVDGTTASVMAIQSADGPRAEAAAQRLRILIDQHLPPGPREPGPREPRPHGGDS